jgi:hypothetical protein
MREVTACVVSDGTVHLPKNSLSVGDDWLGADFLQYGCGIARLGQREYLMLIRSQAKNQRSADRTARTGDQNSHRASFQLALSRDHLS